MIEHSAANVSQQHAVGVDGLLDLFFCRFAHRITSVSFECSSSSEYFGRWTFPGGDVLPETWGYYSIRFSRKKVEILTSDG